LHNLIKMDCPHCGEGFLWKQIEINNVKIKRMTCSYGYMQKNKNVVSILN